MGLITHTILVQVVTCARGTVTTVTTDTTVSTFLSCVSHVIHDTLP
jgi:hypothetical protein